MTAFWVVLLIVSVVSGLAQALQSPRAPWRPNPPRTWREFLLSPDPWIFRDVPTRTGQSRADVMNRAAALVRMRRGPR